MGNLVTLDKSARPLLAYIDCIRGYAVMLVITCHLPHEFPDLPYPVRRLAQQGWHGVQLFFLASALTLLMSWHHESRRPGAARISPFFIRRFFRIAPAYYAAGLFYTWLSPPPGGFDTVQMLLTFGFLNGWSPATLPTVPGAWTVVPGGWSITVEVTFYLLFPLFAALARDATRAVLIFAACCAAGVAANRMAAPMLGQAYPPDSVSSFLYFWFPNQIAVFALGGVLYHVHVALTSHPGKWPAAFLTAHGNKTAAGAMALMLAITYLPVRHSLGEAAPYVPGFLLASALLAVFVLALSRACSGSVLNPLAAVAGRCSFSAYLLHFAVIKLTVASYPQLFHVHDTGLSAIAAFIVAWAVVMGLTFAVAWCTYQLVELPMIAAGKRVAGKRWTQVAQLH